MAVITRGSVSTATAPHTPAVDLIGTDRPERRPLPTWFARLPGRVRAGGLLLAALVAGAARGRRLLVVRQPGGEPVDVPLPVQDAEGAVRTGALDRLLAACGR